MYVCSRYVRTYISQTKQSINRFSDDRLDRLTGRWIGNKLIDIRLVDRFLIFCNMLAKQIHCLYGVGYFCNEGTFSVESGLQGISSNGLQGISSNKKISSVVM